MKDRVLFWIELSAGIVGAIASLVTIFIPDWIELMMHVDPDEGSGSLEWVIVAGLFALSAIASVLARRTWVRIHRAVG
jgi:hypothetical protein